MVCSVSFCLRPVKNIVLVTRILIVELWMDVCIFSVSLNALSSSMTLEDQADPCFYLMLQDCWVFVEKFLKMEASIQIKIVKKYFLFLSDFLELPLIKIVFGGMPNAFTIMIIIICDYWQYYQIKLIFFKDLSRGYEEKEEKRTRRDID